MTVNDFTKQIQGLYGQYNQFQLNHVNGWISSKSEPVLGQVFKYVTENVSWTHNKRPPGLAEFNTALREIRKNPEVEYYEQPRLDEPALSEEDAEKMFAEISKLVKGVKHD